MYSQGVYFEPRAGGEVSLRIFGVYNNKQKKEDGCLNFVLFEFFLAFFSRNVVSRISGIYSRFGFFFSGFLFLVVWIQRKPVRGGPRHFAHTHTSDLP